MSEQTCPRCGVAVAGERCDACGVDLPALALDPISVAPEARPPRAGTRLSQVPTIPDASPAGTRQARPRRLAPPAQGDGSDYRLQRVLGEGGMGVVWAAQQTGLSREVAVKRIRPGAGARAGDLLLAEAALTGSLEHPGIVPVHEVGIDQDGVPFYSMRRLRGRTWAERWPGMSQREHLDVLLRVGDAIAYAHGQGVIHRDIKPANVFLGEYGEVVVFDWGLAVRFADMRPARRTLAAGTPAYMSPEMARADVEQLGPASDVYLLGAVLHEILTGEPPHPGERDVDILLAAADNRIEPPCPPGELGDIARRAMADAVDDRYASVRALQTALRTYLDHQESVALAARAEERLARARVADGYDGFARAVHAFEDAIDLWPENHAAIAGLSRARLVFAGRAREAGDLDLASRLLDAGDPAHGEERLRIGLMHEQRRRRRRALRVFAWSTGFLLAALVGALAFGLLAVSRQRDLILTVTRERDAAEAELSREQTAGAEGLRRMWKRVVQEDFAGTALPASARILAGRWGLTSAQLVVEGGRTAVLAVPLAAASCIVQVDVEPGGRLAVLLGSDAAELARGSAGQGASVAVDSHLTIYRAGEVLASAPLAETAAGLARRLRIEFDQGRLRTFVDGRLVAEAPVPGLKPERIALAGEPGTALDNLKLEVPWE